MTQSKKVPSIGRRLASIVIDHFIMTIIIGAMSLFLALVLSPFFRTRIRFDFHLSGFILIGGIFFSIFLVYFNKDIINGQSIAKRIFKLQVIDNSTNAVASPFQCFVRNITLLIWPIELLVTIVSPTRRIGDAIANTHVIQFEAEQPLASLNWVKVLGTIIFGFFMLLIVLFFTFNILRLFSLNTL